MLLNVNIFQNLLKQNDRLIVSNNNKKILILLCDIDYNKQIAKDKLIHEEVQKLAKEIEIDFIKTKKKEYSLQIFN